MTGSGGRAGVGQRGARLRRSRAGRIDDDDVAGAEWVRVAAGDVAEFAAVVDEFTDEQEEARDAAGLGFGGLGRVGHARNRAQDYIPRQLQFALRLVGLSCQPRIGWRTGFPRCAAWGQPVPICCSVNLVVIREPGRESDGVYSDIATSLIVIASRGVFLKLSPTHSDGEGA
jgi:hypothetical protein